MVWVHEKGVALQKTIERVKLKDIEALIILPKEKNGVLIGHESERRKKAAVHDNLPGIGESLVVLDLEPHQHRSHFHHPFSFGFSNTCNQNTKSCPFFTNMYIKNISLYFHWLDSS